MAEIYKSGQQAEKDDVVMGLINGTMARGTVARLGKGGTVLVARRAPYRGIHEPLNMQHDEVPAGDLTLVLRKKRAPAEAAPAPAKAKKSEKAAAKG